MTVYARTDRVRVLHIIGDSCYGGIAGIILGLGRTARAEGWQVDVLTTNPVVQEAFERQSLGIVNLDVIRREMRPFWDLGGLVRLSRFLRRQRYQIVHTHTSKAGFVGRLAAWLAGVPIVVHTAHGFAIHEQSPAWARIAYSWLERLAARWCHRIVSVSEFHRGWAVQLGICQAATNPGDPERNHSAGPHGWRSDGRTSPSVGGRRPRPADPERSPPGARQRSGAPHRGRRGFASRGHEISLRHRGRRSGARSALSVWCETAGSRTG